MKKEMVEKIESEITQKTKLPDDIKEQARKNIFTKIIFYIFNIRKCWKYKKCSCSRL